MEDVARLEAALTQKQKDDRRSLELKCLLAKHDLTRSVLGWCRPKWATAPGSLVHCTRQCRASQRGHVVVWAGPFAWGQVGKCVLAHPSSAEYESDAWDLERTKLQEKHQLTKKQLEEAFLLHRHQMAERHKKVLHLAQLVAHPYLHW